MPYLRGAGGQSMLVTFGKTPARSELLSIRRVLRVYSGPGVVFLSGMRIGGWHFCVCSHLLLSLNSQLSEFGMTTSRRRLLASEVPLFSPGFPGRVPCWAQLLLSPLRVTFSPTNRHWQACLPVHQFSNFKVCPRTRTSLRDPLPQL